MNNIEQHNQSDNYCELQAAKEIQLLEECRKEITALKLSLVQRDILIKELHASSSWKLTSILRFIAYQIRNVSSKGGLLQQAIVRNGGIKEAFARLIDLYKREGVSGIKNKVRIAFHGDLVAPSVGSDEFDRNDYAEWIRRYDMQTESSRAALLSNINSLGRRPLISVVVPTYNSNLKWLNDAIDSVRNQIYPYWELCIADDASSNPEIRKSLERYEQEDARIKVVIREQNGHISAASNSALELASGEWISFLDHDDLLSPHALALIAETINRYPTARLIYSDEDKIDDIGNRCSPYFKCDFNIDLLRSQNMICHLATYEKNLLNKLGGFRLGFEGSQDYDLALRAVELLDSKQVVHIPHVLYHWRIHPDSTSMKSEAKSYTQDAGVNALREHLARLGIPATVELTPFKHYRIRYAIPLPQPKVTLIIPTRNGYHLIRQCIESILEKTTYENYDILIVDNGSDDPEALAYFSSFKSSSKVRVIREESPFNYSFLNNIAVSQASGDYIGLLNNDIEVITRDWLEEMLGFAVQPGRGAIGARLWYPDETLQHGGIVLGLGGVAGHEHKRLARGGLGYFGRAALAHGVSGVTAACLVIKKSIYTEIGGLNETDLQVAFNDVDFCLKVREAGYQNVWTPFAELYHHESATRGVEDTPEKKARFAKEVAYMVRTWEKFLRNDPAYSPNLTLQHEDFSLAWPPRVTKGR